MLFPSEREVPEFMRTASGTDFAKEAGMLKRFVWGWGMWIGAAMTLATGCDGGAFGGACTQAGCTDGLTVDVVAEGGTFAEGTYELFINAATIPECTFTVSNDPAECANGHCVATEDCNALYLVGVEGNDDVVMAQFPILEGPFNLNVVFNGGHLGESVLEAQYETFSPNGEDCGPTCRSATVTFTVPTP